MIQYDLEELKEILHQAKDRCIATDGRDISPWMGEICKQIRKVIRTVERTVIIQGIPIERGSNIIMVITNRKEI